MNGLKWMLAPLLLVLVSTAASADQPADQQLGEKLVREVWAGMKTSDMAEIDRIMGDGFQAVHEFGAYDAEQEKKLIRGLKLGDYTLSDMVITRNGPVIVATYKVSVEEVIQGKKLDKKPAPRMSVFAETAQGWVWIAHANLKAMK
jgi:hypothetical protein